MIPPASTMKTFGIILLALLAGFVGYQFVYPKLEEWANFETLSEIVPNQQPERQAQTPIDDFKNPDSRPVTEKPVITPEVTPVMSEPGTTPKLEPVVINEPPKKGTNPDEFQAPVFPPIEEVVKGWKEIPKKAFPREVTLLKKVEFLVSRDGKKFGTKVASGGKVYVLDQSGDKVIVAPAPTSPARVEIALGDTNLKELLTDGYERWKPAMIDYLRRQWNFKKLVKSIPDGASNSKLTGRNDKPERNPDGTYPLLLASMKSGGVTEITPANIRKWGSLNVERIDGQEYFTVIVDYTTKTMFGDFDTSAQARIRDGRVVKWIYTGSGEVVP